MLNFVRLEESIIAFYLNDGFYFVIKKTVYRLTT